MSLDNVRTTCYQLETRPASLKQSIITKIADNLKPGPASLFRGIVIPFMQITPFYGWCLSPQITFWVSETNRGSAKSKQRWMEPLFQVFFFFLTFEEAVLFIPLLLDLAGAVFTFEASKKVLRTQTSPTVQMTYGKKVKKLYFLCFREVCFGLRKL